MTISAAFEQRCRAEIRYRHLAWSSDKARAARAEYGCEANS